MTAAEQDAMDREMRDMKKRLDKLEAFVEKLARDDVRGPTLRDMPRWPDYETKGMIADPLGR